MQLQTQQDDRQLIDSVSFLASLVSDPVVIGPRLDVLREITAKLQPGATLTPGQQQQLIDVRLSLTDHLLHHDKLRSFTPETLAEALKRRTDAPAQGQTLRDFSRIGIAVCASYVIALPVLILFAIPQPLLVSAMFSFATLYIGIAWLFWSGLRDFSSQLKRAYRWICAGYATTGLAVCVTPLVVAFPELSEGVLFRYGVIMPSILIANILIWLGVQTFAQTLGTRSWLASWRIVAAATVLTIITFVIPHPTPEPSELWFDMSFSSDILVVLFAGGSSWLAYKISRQTSAMYARAMGWFSASMALIVSAELIAVIPTMYLVGHITGQAFYWTALQFSIAGVFMVISAYMFKRSSGNS